MQPSDTPAISLLGIQPKEMLTSAERDVCAMILTADDF